MDLQDVVGSELAQQIMCLVSKEESLSRLFPRWTGPLLLTGELLGGNGCLFSEHVADRPSNHLPVTIQALYGSLMFYEGDCGERLVWYTPLKGSHIAHILSPGFVRRRTNNFTVEFCDEACRRKGASFTVEIADKLTSGLTEDGIPAILHWVADARGDGGYERCALTKEAWAQLRSMLDAWI